MLTATQWNTLTSSMDRMKSANVKRAAGAVDFWLTVHKQKQNAPKVRLNINFAEREKYAGDRTFESKVSIGKFTLFYLSICRVVRNRVYWSDGCNIDNMDGADFTFSDLMNVSRYLNILIEKGKKND